MDNVVVPMSKPDRIQRLGARMNRDWSIRQFDQDVDKSLKLFEDTDVMPAFDALLAGPAPDMDAIPEPRPKHYVHSDTAFVIACAAFMAGVVITTGMFWVILR